MVGGEHLLCFLYVPVQRDRHTHANGLIDHYGSEHGKFCISCCSEERQEVQEKLWGRRWEEEICEYLRVSLWDLEHLQIFPLLQFFWGRQITKQTSDDYTWKFTSAPGGIILQTSAFCVHLSQYWFISVNTWGSSLLIWSICIVTWEFTVLRNHLKWRVVQISKAYLGSRKHWAFPMHRLTWWNKKLLSQRKKEPKISLSALE